MSDRITHAGFKSKTMIVQEAVQFISHGDMVGFAGFTGAGYPKVVLPVLVERTEAAHERGGELRIRVLTDASTALELDGVLARANEVEWRMPYQSGPAMRNRINVGDTYHSDMHLSHSGPMTEQGFSGPINVAVIEAVRIKADGPLILSSSVGNSISHLNAAEKIIIEVNSWQSEGLEGMRGIYSVGLPLNRKEIPILIPGDHIGTPYAPIDVDKVIAVVEINAENRNSSFKPLDETSKTIAGYLFDSLDGEVKAGRLSEDPLPMQSGVGNIPNAVLAGLLDFKYENLTFFAEVVQDDMIDLIDAGKLTVASGTAFSLSPEYAARMNENAADYRNKIVLRSQDLSNNPGLTRRMELIATNDIIETDIYGNVNSTHVAGSYLMDSVGGSGDFTRNAYISLPASPSLVKDDNIPAIAPMVSHVDHIEHDVIVIITEQGLADFRDLAPRQHSRLIIEKRAYPMYKEALLEYVERAEKAAPFMHTPHDLVTSRDFHHRFLENGFMKSID